MFRQHFAGRFTETYRANCKNCNRGVEDHSNYKNYPSRNYSHRSAIDKSVKVARRQRVQIDFKIPAQRKQGKDPKIVAAEPTPDSLPFSNRKMWGYQVGRQMIGPGLVLGRTVRHEQLGEVTSFQHSHSTR